MNDPEVAILRNDAALHSLKRPQLLALVRRFGLKGSGKNTDLVSRLQQHGALIVERGWDRSSAEPGDASTASWAIVDGAAMPAAQGLEELGVRGTGSAPSTLTSSSSATSLASTIREKGATLLRALVDPGRRDDEPNSAPDSPGEPDPPRDEFVALNDVATSEDDDHENSAAEDDDDGGIRLVSSRSTVADTTMTSLDSPPPPVPHTTSAFVFGSPSTAAAPPASTFTFSSTMPGTLFASTSSTSSAHADQPVAVDAAPPPSTMDSILAEMNRRAAESRAAAPLPRSGSTLFGSASSTRPVSPSKGSRAAFDLDHKRRFDRMDSITTHWAAKRALPASSSSNGNLAGLARSGSSRSIGAAAVAAAGDAPERAPKRLKPSTSRPFGLSRLASSTATASSTSSSSGAVTDQKLVAALRDDGWSAAPALKGAVSLSASLRTAAQPARGGGGLKDVREDVLPRKEQERAQKKRQMELAKARRKSQVASGVGLSRRRPSLGVGPKSSGSTASRLFKNAVRKFTTSSSSSSTSTRPPVPPLPTSSSLRTLAPSTSTRTLATPSTSTLPRFATSTAASASRTALVPASPPKKAESQPQHLGRKKFDLQASLQRPMSWRPHLGSAAASPAAGAPASSPAVVRRSAAFVAPASASRRPVSSLQRTTSSRVANLALLSPVKAAPAAVGRSAASVEDKLAALPPAPSTPFSAPLKAVTNVVDAGAVAAGPAPAPTSAWLPPAVTKKPVLPAASSSSSTATVSRAASVSSSATARSTPAPVPKKKLVSSSTRTARALEKARGKAQVEGLESRARKVRATAAASTSAKAKGKARAE
ncbi:uncharacterized protein RHOBADRAFT_55292 [Rhodotorula graminis WP1]|uniref:SAP domain-containing protein n=1 Tax=Rhodotorula graminis (strain WP1) TaxID=578459 RepID=A0A0P9GJ90_RHOGW|nr:uncharacterized protein RHOBADRAFT_55292 [Rhodotorula graminis WP1]KPV73056.1 hypothetical protein RHOBADRAFT_55292 [Rhodotorula graminis WP1]